MEGACFLATREGFLRGATKGAPGKNNCKYILSLAYLYTYNVLSGVCGATRTVKVAPIAHEDVVLDTDRCTQVVCVPYRNRGGLSEMSQGHEGVSRRDSSYGAPARRRGSAGLILLQTNDEPITDINLEAINIKGALPCSDWSFMSSS